MLRPFQVLRGRNGTLEVYRQQNSHNLLTAAPLYYCGGFFFCSLHLRKHLQSRLTKASPAKPVEPLPFRLPPHARQQPRQPKSQPHRVSSGKITVELLWSDSRQRVSLGCWAESLHGVW